MLDLTRLYPGPLATMLMADMGAEVIKIERPQTPDYMRHYPPFAGEQSVGFMAVNRSKRSLALDLQHAEGRQIFEKLLPAADVLVEQFRPGVLERLELGYEQVRRINPKLVYVSLTGYGQTGPYAGDAGHDLNYIGYAGLLGATGTPTTGPVPPAAQVSDIAGGAYMAVIGTLAALFARERSGEGEHVDVAMLDGTLPLMALQLAQQWATGSPAAPGSLPLSGGLPTYGVYACADGRYVALGALEPKFWQRFCELVGRPDWPELQFAGGSEGERLRQELAVLFATKSREEWVALAAGEDVCLTPVLSLEEVAADAQVRARQMVWELAGGVRVVGAPLKFSRSSTAAPAPPPRLGEHSDAILLELGFSREEIDRWRRHGVVG